MHEDLYELIGGRETVTRATELFYDRVLKDENLRQFFQDVDMAHLRSRQVMFVSMLLGGRVYTGKDIREAHGHSRDHGLTHDHFDLFVAHFRAALELAGVKPENADKVVKRLESSRASVLDA